jgi:hypothetical protein
MVVEKIDLLNLFEPVCKEYRVPISNMKGWADMHSRCNLMRRIKEHNEAGQRCVILVCSDHDPKGLALAELRKNLKMMEKQPLVDWVVPDDDDDDFVIDRFGLNADFG